MPAKPTIKSQADEARAYVKSVLGAQCYVCRVAPRTGWVAHHLSYAKDGVHYARSSSYHAGGRHTDKYAIALAGEVKEHPERFVALCRKHHYAVERMLATEPQKFNRLLDVMMRSISTPKYAEEHRMRAPGVP